MGKYHTMILAGIFSLVLMNGCEKKPSSQEGANTDVVVQALVDSLGVDLERGKALIREKIIETKDPIAKERIRMLLGRAYLFEAKEDSFRTVMDFVETKVKTMKPTHETYDVLAQVYNMRGIDCTYTDRTKDALNYYQQSCQFAQMSGDREKMIDLYINIADSYNSQGAFVNGIIYYQKALYLSDSLRQDNARKAPIFFGLGQTYIRIRNFSDAKNYLDRAEKSYQQLQPSEQFILLNTFGNLYYEQKNYKAALPYFPKAYQLSEKDQQMASQKNIVLLNLSDIYLSIGKLDSARYCLAQCEPYFVSINHSTGLYYIKTLKMAMAVKEGNTSEAKRFMDELATSKEVDPDITDIRLRYQQDYFEKTGDYKKALSTMKEKIALNDSVRKEQNLMKMREISAHYDRDTTIMKKNLLIQQQQSEMRAIRKVNLIFIFLGTALLVAIVLLILYMRKQKEYMMLKYQRKLSELKMEGLRNRLSPHFLLNVLEREMNRFGKQDERHERMVALTKLLHKNLVMVDKSVVTLKDELDFVNLFIDLARPSMKPDFSFITRIDPSIDPAIVRLPAMILEIPVENAIKHGLMDKEEKQELEIEIKDTENDIVYFVRDNGSGFNLNASRGTGTGLKTILKAIQLVNQHNKRPMYFHITNQEDKDDKIQGCRVEIRIPKNYTFTIG